MNFPSEQTKNFSLLSVMDDLESEDSGRTEMERPVRAQR